MELTDLQDVRYEKKGPIAYVTLNRPQAMNAYTHEMLLELGRIWHDVREDPAVRVAILTGAGERAFCAGHDLRLDLTLEGEVYWGEAERPYPVPSLHYADLDVYKPLIAAINGCCLGGGLNMALACDIRIASQNATFGLPQPKWGVTSIGGPQRLVRSIPTTIAMLMILTADPIDAQEAYRIGLVSHVVPLPELLTTATRIAERICENAPLAVQASKEAVVKGARVPLREAIDIGRLLFSELRASEDAKEGLRAFLEKRKPVWKNR